MTTTVYVVVAVLAVNIVLVAWVAWRYVGGREEPLHKTPDGEGHVEAPDEYEVALEVRRFRRELRDVTPEDFEEESWV